MRSTTELGDLIHEALSLAGVTPERVSRWLGRECACRERRERLNALSSWARRVMSGKVEKAGEYLSQLLDSEDHP
jgi:hypothetical protein